MFKSRFLLVLALIKRSLIQTNTVSLQGVAVQSAVQRQRKWESKWDFVSGEFGTLRSDH